MKIDLHVHSEYASNGKWPMRDIFDLAKLKGIGCLAFTDSYCIDGLPEAKELSHEYGIKLVKGVEMQADSRVHILVYGFDENNEKFRQIIKESRKWIDTGMIEKTLKNLKEKYAVNISLEEICRLQNTRSPSTKQICNALTKKGHAGDWKDAKTRYFSPDSPNGNCYVSVKYKAVELVKFAKGANAKAIILAHPHQIIRKEVDVEELMPRLVEAGLNGVEVHYNNQFMDEEKKHNAFKLKKRYGLKLISGGSDFEGEVVLCLGGDPPITSDMISKELLEE